ncbi:MAG: TraB/GumN family protein, partial [Rhodanobacteraceae bacterium]|nr:TraB/GumN family protein [Rhodanobacteraceae bacterium]
ELDEHRHHSLMRPDDWRNVDLFKIVKDGKAGMLAANLALGAYQRRLAEQFGVEPGAELKAACVEAGARGVPVELIDRDVGVTLKRSYAAVGFFDKLSIVGGLVASAISSDKISEQDVEKLKEGDILTNTFDEFARQSQPLHHALIVERDRYMAGRLRQANKPGQRVLAVVGAGHLAGLARALEGKDEGDTDSLETLAQLPPPGIWPKLIGYAVVALLIGGFVWAFSQGVDVGRDLVSFYVLATGGFAALGALLAGGHILSILAAFLSAPLTVLHPALAAGMFSAGAEVWIRKPRVADFEALRDDLKQWSGWWKNRVARTLLVFFLTNACTGIGVYLTGIEFFRRLT